MGAIAATVAAAAAAATAADVAAAVAGDSTFNPFISCWGGSFVNGQQ